MRLFTGINIDPRIVERLTDAIGPLHSLAKIQWSPPENFHVTTKFLGWIPDEQLPQIKKVLREMEKPRRFVIEIKSIEGIPNLRAPRVLYATVVSPPEFEQLAVSTEEVLSGVGVPAERKPFRPHLTIARIKPNQSIAPVRDAIVKLQDVSFGRMNVTTFHLYLSKPTPRGSVYEKLETLPLKPSD